MNKKILEIGKKRNEIIELLKEKGLELAKAKMETILQEEDTITVFDILGTLLEKIKEKCSYILYHDKCPEDLRATLDTIIYASCRLEIEEMHTFRQHIKVKYGDIYIIDASSNKSQLVNLNVVEKLRMKVPQEHVIISRLKQVCKEKQIEYVFPQEIQPMNNMMEGYNINHQNQMHFNPIQPGYDNNLPTKSIIDDNPYSQMNFNQNQAFNSIPNLGNNNMSSSLQYNPGQYNNQNQNNNQSQNNNESQNNFNQQNNPNYIPNYNVNNLNSEKENFNPNQNLSQSQQGPNLNPNMKFSSFQNQKFNSTTPNYPSKLNSSEFPEVKKALDVDPNIIDKNNNNDDGFPKTPQN